MASRTHQNQTSKEKYVRVDATPANSYPPTPGTLESGSASINANSHRRKLAPHFIHEGASYDPSNAKEGYLRMAKDDVPDNKVSTTSGEFSRLGSPGARTILGGPILPLPSWCVQSYTLVSFFSPEAPTLFAMLRCDGWSATHRRFPNKAPQKHVLSTRCNAPFLAPWARVTKLSTLCAPCSLQGQGSLLRVRPSGRPGRRRSCVGTARDSGNITAKF
jgi:hypothetical protein